jgi:branched-chain amino acid transport system ATP-binding protein
MNILELEGVSKVFGGLRAVDNVTFTVEEGQVFAMIGPNGAGKTTTVRTISGLVAASKGRIMLGGKQISGLSAPEIVKRGIGHSPEGRHVFPRLSVRDNLEMGAYLRRDKEVKKDLERVFNLFPRLLERDSQLAGTLSGGEQQMLAMGRAMMTHPRVLLLDEPSLGLSPVLVDTIFQVISELHSEGTTILLIEQNALMALRTASRGYVMETGNIVQSDKADALLESPEVRRAYLGV